MNSYSADLHIHSVLSPCADLEMSPGNIVERAEQKGIEIIAVTDHNHTGHAKLVRELGARKGIWVVYGAEITTQEEVHCLTFFDTDEQLDEFQSELEKNQPQLPNNPGLFGHQVVVDESEQILKEIPHYLHSALRWGISDAARIVHQLGGLFIPAHVDRPTNGLYSHLGFFPEDLEVDGVEISRHTNSAVMTKKHPELAGYQLIQNSDAHFINEIGGIKSSLVMRELSFSELSLALRGEQNREVQQS